MRRSTLHTAIHEQRMSLLQRLADLPVAAWDLACPLPALPPGVIRLEDPIRTVRDIVAHLLVVDGLALDRAPLRPWSAMGGLDSDGGWDARRLSPFLALEPDEMLSTLSRSGERIARVVETMSPAVVRLPVPGARPAMGIQIARRVLHEWVHERDIADVQMLDPRTDAEVPHPAVAEAITDAVLQFLPSVVLPQADADRGVVRLEVLIDTIDGAPRTKAWSADFARKHYGPRVTSEPDARIRCTAASLAMMASSRGDRLPLDRMVDIDGDPALGEAFVGAVSTPSAPMPCPVVQVPLSA